MTKKLVLSLAFVLCAASVVAEEKAKTSSPADAEVAMFGVTPSRNMVSLEKGIPTKFDPDTGLNIKWVSGIGSQTYAGPVIADGQVYVGTNNGAEANPKMTGDRGNMMVFQASDGELLWQASHAKLQSGRVNDWPLQGICSTPFVEGDRLYYLSNRAELVAADTQGFRDGENDGPYKDEEHTSQVDEDIIWKIDLMLDLDVFPHNLAASSPLVVGDIVFVHTSNGVDEDHITLPSPFAPSFIGVNKNTGEILWENNMPGENVLHGQWSNPSYAVVQGTPQVIFPGGDGWIYSLEPDTGELIWKFDGNPKGSKWLLGGAGTKNNIIASAVIYDDKAYVGVGQDPEHGEAPGHFWVIDMTKKGDVTSSGKVWTRSGEEFHRTVSTAAIHDGLLFISDLSGFLYCLDAKTGELYWTHDVFAAIWGSPFVADGKVYLGDEDGDMLVMAASKEFEILHETNMGSAVYTTPTARDGVLYVASRSQLFAIEQK